MDEDRINDYSRRTFLKRAAAGALTGGVALAAEPGAARGEATVEKKAGP
jgi:anaerobic selenocysteine-containing dehydrogenase